MLKPQEEEPKPDASGGWKRSYFEQIARDRDGKPAGPWDVKFNGVVLRIVRIVEAQDQLVVVEQLDDRGQTSRLRIPYAKIEAWQDAE